MKRVLILSYYYPPDLSAGSFRTEALVRALFEEADEPLEVDVLTTTPNRYASFVSSPCERARQPGLEVHRFNVPSHTGRFTAQAWGFCRFYYQVSKWLRAAKRQGRDYDRVYATSSRLMTAFLGARVSKAQKAPLFLDIRDIFTESIRDVYSGPVGGLLYRVFSWVERYTLGRAHYVNVVSDAFRAYWESRYPELEVSVHINGIDDLFLNVNWQALYREPQPPLRVLYAGNVGVAQGLSRLIPELAKSTEGWATFDIVGDGTDRAALEKRLKSLGVTNVSIMTPVSRDILLEHYQRADVLILQLTRLPALERVLPSKLFEYAVTGKPFLAGVNGYAREFLKEHVEGVSFFDANDPQSAEATLKNLSLQYYPRDAFRQRFPRRDIMKSLARDVLNQ